MNAIPGLPPSNYGVGSHWSTTLVYRPTEKKYLSATLTHGRMERGNIKRGLQYMYFQKLERIMTLQREIGNMCMGLEGLETMLFVFKMSKPVLPKRT